MVRSGHASLDDHFGSLLLPLDDSRLAREPMGWGTQWRDLPVPCAGLRLTPARA